MGLDSFHKDEINFGREEAIRMHATHQDWRDAAAKWLRSTTGQEFLDEVVWGGVDHTSIETLNALLREFGANINENNRVALLKMADHIITREGY